MADRSRAADDFDTIKKRLDEIKDGRLARSVPESGIMVSAMDSQSVASFFRQNAPLLVEALNRAMRKGPRLT